MPGDGKPSDKLYMSFGLEYLDAVNQWATLPSSSSGWVLVGAGSSSARQSGWSFTLKPPQGRGKFVLRGIGRLPLDAFRAPVRPRHAADDRRAQGPGGRRTGRVQRRQVLALIRPARTGGGRW